MPEILLVNPRKRRKTRRKKSVAKKRRSAAQKAATRKMIAANKRRKNPVKRRRTRKTPVKRRASARRTPVRKRRRSGRRRSNPRLTMRSMQNQLMDAGTGAFGALGLDIIQGYLPIPAQFKVGLVGTGVKALLAIGMGVVASNFQMIRGATANKMVNGALTVVLHDEMKKLTQQFAPGLPMGEYLNDNNLGYAGSGYAAGVMSDDDPGMGSYLPELDVSMEQDGFGEYLTEPDYMENMAYSQ